MNKFKFFVVGLLLIVVGTTTVCAASSTTKQSTGLDIRYENLEVLTESNVNVELNDLGITFDSHLQVPGDYFEFTVDMVNYSDMDAKIDDIEKSILSADEKRFLEYKVSYLDGSDIEVNQVLKAKEIKTIKVRLDYKYDITAEDLPTKDYNTNLFFNVNFIEK